MIALLLTPFLIILCRLSGNSKEGRDVSKWWRLVFMNKALSRLLIGIVSALAMGIFSLDALVVGVLCWAGMATGWGEPNGAILLHKPMIAEKLEWWQVGALKTNAVLAMGVRALALGLPVALFGLWRESLPTILIGGSLAASFFCGCVLYRHNKYTAGLTGYTNGLIDKVAPFINPQPITQGALIWTGAECLRGLFLGAFIILSSAGIYLWA